MRTCHVYYVGLIAAGCLLAQEPETVKGQLLEWDGTAGSGELTIRTGTHNVYLFRFDEQTRFERDNRKVSIAEAAKGEQLEILSDPSRGLREKYARVVHLLGGGIPWRPTPARRREKGPSLPGDYFFSPRGNLTFAGLVIRLTLDKLTLRTREGERTVVLRQDTRYLEDGAEVGRSALELNARVFVRAGRNLDRAIEAYQVIWGKILVPR